MSPDSRRGKAAPSVRFVDEVVELAAVFASTTSVVTLRRAPWNGLMNDALRASTTPGFRRVAEFTPETAMQSLGKELDGFPHLVADVQLWAEVLVELTGCKSVGLRIAVMQSPMCPRLHVDLVTLRLVVTYLGPGTEFVSNHQVDRNQLGHKAGDRTDEESGLLLAPGCVQRAGRFDVVLLKGEAWPENKGFGAVHRSPPMHGASPRLVMTLDPL